MKIADRWDPEADVCLHLGETLDLLRQIPPDSAQLIITSPPYNLNKEYERGSTLDLEQYSQAQALVIAECVRVLRPGGSICWQVGNFVRDNQILPLDILLFPIFARHDALKLRNRIVWHFEHGLHCTRRLSGRYEVVLWFSKGDEYVFNVDPIRVPQKYPGKRAWKGPNAGRYTGNILGKNPGDVWILPNVKANHVEKTTHPCQFPVELVERFVLSVTNPGDLVIDPYMGVGSTACAAVLNRRRAAGAELVEDYLRIARERVVLAADGKLKTRPLGKPVHQPDPRSALARRDADRTDRPSPPKSRRPAQGMRIAEQALSATPSASDGRFQSLNDDSESPSQLDLLSSGPERG